MTTGSRRERSGLAARRLKCIALSVVLQVAFDLITPEGSFTAHAAELVVGSLVAALLAGFQRRAG